MSHPIHTAPNAAPHWSLPDLILAPFRAVLWLGDAASRARETMHTYDRLATRSDSTLAKEGLSREDVPRAAFARHFGR